MSGMTMRAGLRVALLGVSGLVAACSSSGANPTQALTAAPTTASSAAAGAAVNATQVGQFGMILTGSNGKTLYVFEKDQNGQSACYDKCAESWPALTVDSAAAATAGAGVTGTVGTTQRTDGKLQVTVNGAPVYYYSGDSAAGQANGQGVGNLWYVVGADGKKIDDDADMESPEASSSVAPKYNY
jgi:predicted lipoprotein with Yx(FWY)xxD motif